MHRQVVNELRLGYAIEPRGPILIKSGKEAGADPTLLDMNFVRLEHAALGRPTVYLPGSSLKGTVRSYCEKIARTVGHGSTHDPPFSCNPLGDSDKKGKIDYSCGKWFDRQKSRERTEDASAAKYARSCAVCRIFGNTSLASHVRFSDAYPLDPSAPEDLAALDAANSTGQRDGVAIDRVSGAVAVGPFNLEVVTKGVFFGDLVFRNFQLWQVGLLAIALRDIARERVPIGFSKSRGLGRVNLRFKQMEIAYPGRFRPDENGKDFIGSAFGAAELLDPDWIKMYDFRSEDAMPLPTGGVVADDGSYGRVAVVFDSLGDIEHILGSSVVHWRAFVEDWRNKAGS